MNTDNCARKLFSLAIVAALVNLTFVSCVDITKLDPITARFLVLICGFLSIVFYLLYESGKDKLIELISGKIESNSISQKELSNKLDLANPKDCREVIKNRVLLMDEKDRLELIRDIEDTSRNS